MFIHFAIKRFTFLEKYIFQIILFFVSINSFIQNNIIIGKKVRKNVSNILTNFKGLTLGIGGESYMYMKSGHFISNSKSIINDCINNTYLIPLKCKYINYNNININITYDKCASMLCT